MVTDNFIKQQGPAGIGQPLLFGYFDRFPL